MAQIIAPSPSNLNNFLDLCHAQAYRVRKPFTMRKKIEFLTFSGEGVTLVPLEDMIEKIDVYAHSAFTACLIYKQIEIWAEVEESPTLRSLQEDLCAKALLSIKYEARKGRRWYKIAQLEYLLNMLPGTDAEKRDSIFEIQSLKSRLNGENSRIVEPPLDKVHVKRVSDTVYMFHIPQWAGSLRACA